MSRVQEQMDSHPVSQLEDPESIAMISKEIISLEEQVGAACLALSCRDLEFVLQSDECMRSDNFQLQQRFLNSCTRGVAPAHCCGSIHKRHFAAVLLSADVFKNTAESFNDLSSDVLFPYLPLALPQPPQPKLQSTQQHVAHETQHQPLTLSGCCNQVRQGWKTEQKLKQPAWEEFLAVCRVLRRYDALKDQEEDGDLQVRVSIPAVTSRCPLLGSLLFFCLGTNDRVGSAHLVGRLE